MSEYGCLPIQDPVSAYGCINALERVVRTCRINVLLSYVQFALYVVLICYHS